MSLSDDDKKLWVSFSQKIKSFHEKDGASDAVIQEPKENSLVSMKEYFCDKDIVLPSKLLKQKTHYMHASPRGRSHLIKPVIDDFFYHVFEEPKQGYGVKIDAVLDLHGHTLDQAHEKLILFLEKSQQYHCRWVIIITGKSGALYEKVPRWIELMMSYVHSFQSAPPQHGGKGALVVHIRRLS